MVRVVCSGQSEITRHLSSLTPHPHSFGTAFAEIEAAGFAKFLRNNGMSKLMRDHFSNGRLPSAVTPTPRGV
jgi:hypothetical protein